MLLNKSEKLRASESYIVSQKISPEVICHLFIFLQTDENF